MLSNVDIKDWTELFGNETLVNVPRDSVVSFQDRPDYLWHYRRTDGAWAQLYDLYDLHMKSVAYANPLAQVKVWSKNETKIT